MDVEHGYTLQVRLTPVEAQRLRRIVETSKLAVPDVVRVAVDRMDDLDDEELSRLLPDEAAASWPPWWTPLCQELERMRLVGEPVVTPGHGVENKILKVNQREGWIELKSERAQSGKKRKITAKMLENEDATTHGVIIRTLRALVGSGPASTGRWIGPFRIRDLLERCLDENQAWPPEQGGVYLVSREKWTGAPRAGGSYLYLGGISGSSPRFCTRVGDLLADTFGFFGGGTGHSSGGQRLNDWCVKQQLNPLDLHLGWFVPADGDCNRCLERRWHGTLKPVLNRYHPPRCEHA